MRATARRRLPRWAAPGVMAAVLLAVATPSTWAACKFSALRIDESVAAFNMYAGNFLVPDEVNVSADYEYDNSQGGNVFIGAEVWSGGSRDTRFGYGPFKVTTNTGRATCRISVVPERMPPVHQPIATSQIVFKMYKGGGASFYTKSFDLDLVWPKPFDKINRADIAASDASLKTQAFNVGMQTQFVMIVGKTNQGRYFAALCEHMPNANLVLRQWKVFAPSGAVHRSGNNTQIQRTATIDLDSGSDAAATKDLWWQFETETKRNITPRNGARICPVYLRYANYNIASPPSKRIFLELDKLQGLEWTPYVVDRGGRKHSMQSIYAAAGYDLKLVSDEGNIADLKNGAAYTRAEMEAFKVAHMNRTAPAGYWHMYGAMLTRDTGGNLGLMFSTGDRKGFAVFISQFGADDFARILRTSAHELGHALNMFHSDGDANVDDAPQAGRGRTVMNQTWTLAGDWGYEWHTPSRGHLTGHPVNRIQPDTGYGFNQCIDSHLGIY